jgi:hypothetical protein
MTATNLIAISRRNNSNSHYENLDRILVLAIENILNMAVFDRVRYTIAEFLIPPMLGGLSLALYLPWQGGWGDCGNILYLSRTRSSDLSSLGRWRVQRLELPALGDGHLWFIAQVVSRPHQSKGFILLRKRWFVERTFGWWQWWWRLVQDYEQSPENAEALLQIAMIRIMLRRLA